MKKKLNVIRQNKSTSFSRMVNASVHRLACSNFHHEWSELFSPPFSLLLPSPLFLYFFFHFFKYFCLFTFHPVLGIDTFFGYRYFWDLVSITKSGISTFRYLTMIPILRNQYFSIPNFDKNLRYRYLNFNNSLRYFSIPLNSLIFLHGKLLFFKSKSSKIVEWRL